ncbi:MAG: type II and III secretion system protein family protein [Phycisphaerae bacterium]
MRTSPAHSCLRAAIFASAAFLLAGGGTQAGAQQPGPGDETVEAPFMAQVVKLNERAKTIRIPVNQSVLIETNRPSERIQAIDPSIVFVQSVAPNQILVTGVGTGTSQVLVWADDGQQHIFEVHVEINLVELNRALEAVDPLSKVEAVPLMGSIVLTGIASSTRMAERLLNVTELFVPPGGASQTVTVRNHMTVAGEQQVLLRCTVAEVSRSAARKLGINGFLGGENFRDVFAVNQIGGINPINIGAQGFGDVRQNFNFGAIDGIPLASTVPLSLGFPRVQMQVFVQALADNSLLRVLAEPNLVAISGETASFLVGGEFPIPVPQGIDQVTIEFREFGARLNFTPVVRAGQRIRLHVAPEVSELDFSSAVTIAGFSVPGLTQRRVESTVEVGSGQTLAIAGLLSDEVRGVASRIPGLGDVPILGALFRSVDYRRQITELVILVTPEIVAPLNPNQVPDVPGQDFQDPDDFELYALGLLEPLETAGQPATGIAALRDDAALVDSEPDQNTLHGPWGYSTAEE